VTFDLNLLLTFEAIDKARSVSGAARLLGLSQPATSAALSRLRTALGDELFSYAGGAMQPTPVARRLAPGLHAALADLRGVLDAERRFEPATAQGCFVIGVTDYASALDLVIGSFADPPDRSVATPLLREVFTGVARIGHPALSGPMDAVRFAGLDHALFTLARDGRGAVDDLLATQGLTRRVCLALPHLMALPEILRATDLVAAVPCRAAARFGPGIATFDLAFLGLAPWTLHMLWSPFARKDSATAWLREAVSRVSANL